MLAAKRPALSALFSLQSLAASEFGTGLHALLAQVEWLPPVPMLESAGVNSSRRDAIEALLPGWRERLRTDAPDLVRTATACLSAPALSAVWQKPATGCAELWRERAFEIVLDDAWVTGAFDRVVVERDESGRAMHATVYDFKSDKAVDDEGIRRAVTRYEPQLTLYRRVAAVLAGLPPDRVQGVIVFTHACRQVSVPS